MISLRNWKLDIPARDRMIGEVGENLAFTLAISTDAGPKWTFFLYMRYAGGTTMALPLTWEDGTLRGELTRPYLSVPGPVMVTVQGQNGAVISTSNVGVLYIGRAVSGGTPELDPTLYDQLLTEIEKRADALDLNGLMLKLLSGDKVLSKVELPPPGGGEGGTTDHRYLSHRDAEEQHPIEAISGLEEIPNKRVLEIWNGGMSS